MGQIRLEKTDPVSKPSVQAPGKWAGLVAKPGGAGRLGQAGIGQGSHVPGHTGTQGTPRSPKANFYSSQTSPRPLHWMNRGAGATPALVGSGFGASYVKSRDCSRAGNGELRRSQSRRARRD